MNIKFNVISSNFLNSDLDCFVLFVTGTAESASSSLPVDNALSETIGRRLEAGDLVQKQGEMVVLYDVVALGGKKALLVYVDTMEMTNDVYHALCQQVVNNIDSLSLGRVGLALDSVSVHERVSNYLTQTFVEAFVQKNYAFDNYKETPAEPSTLSQVSFLVSSANELVDAEQGVKSGRAVGLGKNVARDLGNMPPNVCHPTYLAERAIDIANNNANVTTRIVDEDEMETLGMMSFLSVGRGSEQPSKLIVMEYNNAANKDEKPYALVGKGITFDSGGISIKPGAAMDEMKFDMCGAAAVFGTMESVLQLQLPINLVCVVAAAENMPSANATRPGDIIKSMSGKTIEILNTDAEGRLVLCDALTYVQQYEPKTIIDIATLTGAILAALGEHTSGLFSNDDDFAKTLSESGMRAGDKVWQLPIWPEYTKKLKSPFADLANIGSPGAGSITAACFLSEFVKDQTWAHIDIAGTAWLKGSSKGGTGRPVAMLVDYLTQASK